MAMGWILENCINKFCNMYNNRVLRGIYTWDDLVLLHDTGPEKRAVHNIWAHCNFQCDAHDGVLVTDMSGREYLQ